jgi:hypothetical protein
VVLARTEPTLSTTSFVAWAARPLSGDFSAEVELTT